jgi:hypothetical protein
MAKKTIVSTENNIEITEAKTVVKPAMHSLEWTDYVLSLLSDDEKIKGNPTTDGLRRIFEIALDCTVVTSSTKVAQCPDHNNEKRATVVHSIGYILNSPTKETEKQNTINIDGAADVYWGNCDKIYRNHPVAVAETRAEGRALRRALRLRKVVAAEEIAENIEDHVDGDSIGKITPNQINFIDVLAKRLDINISKTLEKLALSNDNIYNIKYDDAVIIVKTLSDFQQDHSKMSSDLIGYDETWKHRS